MTNTSSVVELFHFDPASAPASKDADPGFGSGFRLQFRLQLCSLFSTILCCTIFLLSILPGLVLFTER